MAEKYRGMIPISYASGVLDDPMADTMVRAMALSGAEDAAEQKGLEINPDTLKEAGRFEYGFEETPEGPRMQSLQFNPSLDPEGVMIWFEAYTKDKSDG